MSLIQPVAISEKPSRKRISYVNVQVSASEKPASKAFSFVDIQALGLILLILLVVSMPVYTSVLQNSGKQTSRPTLVVRQENKKNAEAEQEGRKERRQEGNAKKQRNPGGLSHRS